MAGSLPLSEFGGKVQRNTIQPAITPAGMKGHTDLDAHEKLRLLYLTGQEENNELILPDNGEVMTGIEPIDIAREKAPKPPLYRDVSGG